MTSLEQQRIETIFMPNAPAIPGRLFRFFDGPDDFAAVAAMFDAARVADQLDVSFTAADMRPYYAPTATFSPRYDQVLAEMNEQVIAYGRVDHGVDVEGVHLYYTTGHVHPRWRRQGLGHAILHHNEWRLRAIAATQPRDEPRVFAAWAVDTASDTEALLQNVGYRPVDHFYAMLRDSDATQLDAPLPPSFTIRPVRPTDYRTIWEPEQEAFRDH